MLSSKAQCLWRSGLLGPRLGLNPFPNSVSEATLPVTRVLAHDLTLTQKRNYLTVGYRAESTKTYTEEDVQAFSDLTGDLNPIHMDKEYSATTRFRQPIVHGVLQLGLIAGVVGTKLPGAGTVSINYDVKHPYPLYIGEEVRAYVEVTEVDRRRITLKMVCKTVGSDKVTTEGTMRVLAPKELVK